MADRGRDLSIGLVSDVSRFQVDQPAKDLDKLADAAQDAARDTDKATDELRRLATQGQDAQRELDRLAREARDNDLDTLGRDAKDTARKVDDAFDKIADSSKASMRQVGDHSRRGMKEAESATDTFRDEAKQNVSEVVSSFDGSMDSIADVVQGTLGGVVSDLGKVGIAAGAAGAVAVGYIYSQITAARERVEELRSALTDLFVDPGGDTLSQRITTIVDSLKDSGRLKDLAADARLLRIDFADYIATLAEGGPAAATMTEEIRALGRAARGAGYGEAEAAAIRLGNATYEAGLALEGAELAADAYAEATRRATDETGVSQDTIDTYTATLDNLASTQDDVATAVEEAARRKADATKDETDTWQDYADNVTASIDDVIAAQERDIQARMDFQENAQTVYDAVGQAGVDWALSQGENADKAMELLANAPAAKQQEIVDNFTQAGELGGDKFATGISDKGPTVNQAAADVHAGVKGIFGQRVDIPVGVSAPTTATLWQVRRSIEAGLGSITVPVAPGTIRAEAASRYRP